MYSNFSHQSLNSILSTNKAKFNQTVDSFLAKTGLSSFVILMVFLLAIVFSSTNAIIYCMSITTFIPKRSCVQSGVNNVLTVYNSSSPQIVYPGDEEIQDNYCANIFQSADWHCTELEEYPFNATQQFNLECDPQMKLKFSMIGMIYNLSMTVGASMIGYLLDAIGRKQTLILGAVIQLMTLLVVQYATDFWIFLIGFAGLGFCGEFFQMPSQVLATELVSRDNSMTVGTSLNILDALNGIITVLLQKQSMNLWWLVMYMIIRVVVITILVIILCPESPYQLYTKDKIVECNQTLSQIAKNSFIDDLPLIDKEETADEQGNNHKSDWNLGLIFCLLLNGLLWMSVVLIFQQMFQQAKYFPTDLYTTLILEMLACMTGYLISGIFIKSIGNKRSISLAYCVIIFLSFIQDEIKMYDSILYAVIFTNILMASLIFNIVQIMPPLQFYQDIVGKVYGIVNVQGRLGGIIAPLFSEYMPPNLTLIIFSLIGLICTIFIRHQKQYDPRYINKLKQHNIEIPEISLKKRKGTIHDMLKLHENYTIKEDLNEDFTMNNNN